MAAKKKKLSGKDVYGVTTPSTGPRKSKLKPPSDPAREKVPPSVVDPKTGRRVRKKR